MRGHPAAAVGRIAHNSVILLPLGKTMIPRPALGSSSRIRGGNRFGRGTGKADHEKGMETLYDLLGALPRDDAEGLRAAFRRAVKGSHPDLNPGDPDAGLKFRQIVRANEILTDEAQRAAYDHLLDLARIEQEQASQDALAGGTRGLTAWALALAGLSATAIAGLMLFLHLSAGAEPAAETDLATREAIVVTTTAEQPVSPPVATTETVVTTETADNAAPPLGPPIDITPSPTILDRVYGLDRPPADISRTKRLAKKKPMEAAPRSASPRRTVEIESWRRDTTPFAQRP